MNGMIRIMLVDTDTVHHDSAGDLLEMNDDFEVIPALSAEEAILLVQTRPVDIIISEYRLSGMDGTRLVKEIRRNGDTTPFLLTTHSQGREEKVIEALNNGADRFLEKSDDIHHYLSELTDLIRVIVTHSRATKDLIESEKQISDILNFLPDPTFAIDNKGVVIAWNQAMEKLTLIPACDILGKGEYEYSHHLYHERKPILIDLVLADDTDITAHYPIWKRRGKTLYAESTTDFLNQGKNMVVWHTATPLYNTKGTITGAIESIRDVTDLKYGEKNLKKSKERLLMAQEIGKTGCWEYHIQTERLWGSAEGLRIFGFPSVSRELTIDEIEACIVNREEVHQALNRLIHSEGEYNIEYLIKPVDGSPLRYVHSVARMEGNKTGEGEIIRGIIQDITDRKTIELEVIQKNQELYAAYEQVKATEEELRHQLDCQIVAEENLRQTKDLLENLISVANVPIIIWDSSFHIIRLNHAFELLIGRSAYEIAGKTLHSLFPVDKADMSVHQLQPDSRASRRENIELEILHRDCSLRTIQWNIATLYDADGSTPLATIAQGHDITYERRLEKEKNEALTQIKQNLAQLSILNDGIRNPLTVINIVTDRVPDDDTREKILLETNKIDEMVRHLDRRWMESIKILGYLQKHHQVSFDSSYTE